MLTSGPGQVRVKGWSIGVCFNLHAAERDAAIPESKRITTHLMRHCIDMPTLQELRAMGMATLQARTRCGDAKAIRANDLPRMWGGRTGRQRSPPTWVRVLSAPRSLR